MNRRTLLMAAGLSTLLRMPLVTAAPFDEGIEYHRMNLDRVPAVMVGGEFLTSPTLAEGRERMIQVLDYLVDEVTAGSSAAAESTLIK